jgi:hypothetical protein
MAYFSEYSNTRLGRYYGSVGSLLGQAQAPNSPVANGWRPVLPSPPLVLTPPQLQAAIAQNRVLATRMGWDVLYGAIAGWILDFRNTTPAPADFARAVARWQMRQLLPATGIIDANTWSAMLADAKAGIPRPFQTPEGVARPHGLQAIVATFGNPTQAGWGARNLVPVAAPAGQTFAPGIARLPFHRLIAPQFDRVFAGINSNGLWIEFFPSAGAWVCRTKKSDGKRPCGTPGIQPGQLSNHSWGIAIDFQAQSYPFYTANMQQAGRPLRYPAATITSIFQAHGFHWGLWFMNGRLTVRGRIDFTGSDPMHFQFATGY